MRFLRTENTKILDVWFVKNEKGLRVVVFQNISDKNMKCVKSMKIMSRKCENGLKRHKKSAQISADLSRVFKNWVFQKRKDSCSKDFITY